MSHQCTPKISLVAYESKIPGKVFVGVPNERGRYVLTDRCVIEVECGACCAAVGEPCHNKHGVYWSGTHCDRRSAWQRLKRNTLRDFKVDGKYFVFSEEKPRIRVPHGSTIIYI